MRIFQGEPSKIAMIFAEISGMAMGQIETSKITTRDARRVKQLGYANSHPFVFETRLLLI
jgi:hypothetical protein